MAAGALIGGTSRLQAQDLVIRIDDMASSHSANVASIDTYRNGIATSVEIMPVCAWFPEAVKMLRENPGLDVGVHLTITSEWENVKWRPLTHCPSLVDEDGYFYPMMGANESYPGQSVKENLEKMDLKEIEQEYRAQIELALKHIPQVTHLTGHMGSCRFSPEVAAIVARLSQEYGLPSMDSPDSKEKYSFQGVGYKGAHGTLEEKKESFIKMLDSLEKGKRYVFLDHPAYDDSEMAEVYHIGYENVAEDRQGVTDLLKSPEVRKVIEKKGIRLIDFNYLTKQLPRGECTWQLDEAVSKYLACMQEEKQDLHSIMILKDGKVVYEKWLSSGKELEPHVLNSVSKTFTSAAVGFAVQEGRIRIEDKVIDYFPDKLPQTISENLAAMTVRDLLTMNTGHEKDPTKLRNTEQDWEKAFLASDIPRKPGTIYCYNSLGTYMLSAIVQRVTGEKIADYLYPRLFRPLGINNVSWQESPTGINAGGWGLYLKTEDLAKLGQLLLQGGVWEGKQVMPAEWVREMSARQVDCVPAGINTDKLPEVINDPVKQDWVQGYGYQMWRCRHNAFRADGASGQYIIVIPDKNAVIVTTAQASNMRVQINKLWDYVLPALYDTPEMYYGDTSRKGVPFSKDPHVVSFNGRYLMYFSIPPYQNDPKSGWNIGVAQSEDLVNWEKVGEVTPAEGADYEKKGLCAPCAVVKDGKVHLFYQTYGNNRKDAICHAVSEDGINFKRNPTNPIFSPTGDWNCGRAIDAEVYHFKDRYFLYYATRDKDYKIQMQGVAVAPGDTDFSRDDWKQATDAPILAPVHEWEGQCIEGASIIKRGNRLVMFYAGSYNNAPQQVGVAVSKDGIVWKRLSDEPFLTNGKPGEWNSSESGHPHIFEDADGRTYLFYQGNNDKGKTWYLSQKEVLWKKDKPYLTE